MTQPFKSLFPVPREARERLDEIAEQLLKQPVFPQSKQQTIDNLLIGEKNPKKR